MIANLLSLLDDIATSLDDIAVMSKIATKKTTGILGDDLALNAEQVTGIASERELPLIWRVFKGSLLNKVILVPISLLLTFYLPIALKILLLCGGLYLCFEGTEKVWEKILKLFNKTYHPEEQKEFSEDDKAKGAIRTDFILSAEIIVIALSSMSAEPFIKQAVALSFVALLVTVGIYGLVALIVKIDDFGLWLMTKNVVFKTIGKFLVWLSPKLIKSLGVIGTIAMFLVGGGIVKHTFHWSISKIGFMEDFVFGLSAGIVCLMVFEVFIKIKQKYKKS